MGVLACLAARDRQWLTPMPGVCYPAHQECTIECDGSSGKLRCVLKEAGGNMRDPKWFDMPALTAEFEPIQGMNITSGGVADGAALKEAGCIS